MIHSSRRNIGLLWLAFRLGALDAVQYRADFFVQLVQSIVSIGTALAGVAVVFGQTDDLAGWSQDELVALIGVFTLVAGLSGMVVRPSMERLMEGVRLGTLDFTLTKPADAQLLVSVQRVDVWRTVDVLLGAALLLLAISRLEQQVGAVPAVAFGLMLVAGVAIIYSFLLILATLAFWLVRLENILVIYASMYEAGRWPIGIYPPWLRVALTFVVPIAFAVTIPVESLTGRLDAAAVLGTLCVAFGFLLASRWFLRLGLRRYTGASA